MEKKIENFIEKAVQEYSKRTKFDLPKPFEFDLNVTKDPTRGDFATNVAFRLAKAARQKPALIADALVLLMEEIHSKQAEKLCEKMEVAGGGFINFFLAKASFASLLLDVHQKDRKYGKSDFGKEKKVLLEFVSANPTGPLTIAHGRQAAIGDSLARILKTTGHEVTCEYYLNDGGRQMDHLGQSLWVRYREMFGMDAEIPEDGYKGDYVRIIAEQLAKKKQDGLLREKPEKAVEICREFAKDEIMKGIREDLKTMGVTFDHYFTEGSLYKSGAVEKALGYLEKQGHLYEQDGALWFRSTTFGDDKDRVVKKSSGDFTYLAPDIAYHRNKFERGFNWLINLWGPDHHGYIQRLKSACQALGHPAEEVAIRIVQLTTLYRKGEPVRMSTREGEFVTLQELESEVGVDATRFFFTMRRFESPLDFDLELAKQKSQENPVYYLQYAHARIASLIQFADQPVTTKVNLDLLAAKEETDLIKVISEYPKNLIAASQSLEPYRLADYLRDLAATFHKFYQKHRVVTDDKELTKARLLLVEATRITLRNGLVLLGISQPESM